MTQRTDVLVIGAGQAGLAVGQFLARTELSLRIVDAGPRIGWVWRRRWDSLRLFTAAKHNDLPGMAFPGDRDAVPGKDQVADYLLSYAQRFDLPVECDTPVERLTAERGGPARYRAVAGGRDLWAEQVVVATGPTGTPRIPELAGGIDPAVTQVHAAEYRNPGQLPDGPVLVVGAGNSGAEIAVELARTREVWLAGREVGALPVKLAGLPYRLLNRFVTSDTRWGRSLARGNSGKGTPLVRLTEDDLTRAGVRRLPRVDTVDGGMPVAGGLRVEPAAIIWSTGYVRDFSWVDLPVLTDSGDPDHHRGVVRGEPGLYVLGLPFLHSFASSLLMGMERDAHHIAETVLRRHRSAGRRTPLSAGGGP
jgi:putative flavoprotein involved in K+ transport